MTYRLLKRHSSIDVELASSETYATATEASDAAGVLCRQQGWTVLVVQDIAEVQMAPTVVSLTPPSPASPAVVYRGPVEPEPEPEYAGPPRVPEAKPRLLVLPLRQPTEAELAKYLMVVAQGKVIKNTFGALEVPDMPLKPDEYLEVKRAMQGY